MSVNSNARPRLDFGNLPLVEAAVRASFQPGIPISLRFVLGLGATLRDTFPLIRDPGGIEVAPGIGPSPAEFGPTLVPGADFDGSSTGIVVSVRPQVIIVRWVKQIGTDHLPYPRFAALRDALWKTVEASREISGDSLPAVYVVNMSYVNFLAIPHGPKVLRDYFSEAAQVKTMDNASVIRKLEASWGEQGGIDLRFSVDQVTVKSPDAREGYQLTTAAGLRVPVSVDAKTALERVHDRLQGFFSDLISQKAKSEWQLKEPGNV
jgi:uncharacterized protein (TIGR04255 family)